jgi:outer membrane protein TolC
MMPRLHSPHHGLTDRHGYRLPYLESNGMNAAGSSRSAGRSRQNLKRIFTVAAMMVSLSLAGHGQRTDATVPNAPRPSVILSNTATPTYLSRADAAPAIGTSNRLTSDSATAGDVSLYTVVDLALRNSHAVHIAEAEQQRTRAIWMETRDIYIPNFSIGSGLGYSYGFPLGNPTLFNVQSQFLAFSFSQPDYIRSAHAAVKAATLSLTDVRRQVILDASINYIELNKTLAEIHALQQAAEVTDTLVSVVQDRLNAGLESKMNLTQAKLTRAQIQLQMIHLEDHADELRKHISGLTGLDPNTITPAQSSVPPLPDLDYRELMSAKNESPAVQAASATADARMYNAWGDKRAQNRPIVYGAFQYARFAAFNGYDQYYQHFTPNNIGIGINATWPLFDRSKRDRAEESAAIAKHDRQQAVLAKIQNDEGNLALWHSLRELEAQEQVADLKQQLAQDTLTATITEMNQGGVNGQPVAPQQAEQYRVEERTGFVSFQDAQFNVTRVKLNLLSAVGGLEDWAKQSVQSPNDSATAGSPASSH